MLAELKSLAEERSAEKRADLLHKIADLFFAGIDEHSDAERILFNEVIENIVDQISRAARIDVATNLATQAGFPIKVVRKLANDDDIEIAGPVIQGSPDLDDNDLIAIACKGADGHLAVIAGRDRLSEGITDVLVDRGSRGVVHKVSHNHGARFSNGGMLALVNKARDDLQLQIALVNRPDLTKNAVDNLLPIITAALAFSLAERGYDVSSKLPPHLVEHARRQFELAMANRNQQSIAAYHVFGQFLAGRLSLEEALLRIVECEQMLEVAALLAYPTRLDRHLLMGVLSAGPEQNAMVLLRAIDQPWSTASKVLALRAKKQRIRQFTAPVAEKDYLAVDVTAAKRILRFLQVRSRMAPGDETAASDIAAA
jgi:Uncharacterised protein conserved in bacteria (DUF2336)